MKETRSIMKRAVVIALVVVTTLSMLCTFETTFTMQEAFADETESEETDSWGGDLQNAETILLDETKTVSITEDKVVGTFKFTPEQDGTYIFYADGDEDTEGQVLDSNGNRIAYNDDLNGSNFGIVFEGEAGGTYYLQASLYDQESSEASFTVTLAESNVAAISFENENGIETTENTGGNLENGDEGSFFYYEQSSLIYREGSVITVKDKDGNETKYVYDADEDEFISENGDKLNGLKITDDQYSTPWTVGDGNILYLNYMGKTCEVPVTIIANHVVSFSYKLAAPITLIEGVDGDTNVDDNDEEYFQYDLWYFRQDGDVLTTTDNEGNDMDYVYDAEEGKWVAENGDNITWDDVYVKTDQYYDHWGLGEHTVTLEFMGKTFEISVTVKANPVKDISLELPNNGQVKENTCGSWYVDDNDEKYYNYELDRILATGAVLNVEDADGNVTAYTFDVASYQWVADNGDVINTKDADVRFDVDEQSESHWTIGDFNQIIVKYMGRTASADFTIVEEISQPQPGKDDEEKAAAVEKTITSSIPADVTLEDEAAVTAAKEAYEALTDDQKALVSKEVKEKLDNAVSKIAELKEAAKKQDELKKAEKAYKQKVKAAKAAKVKKISLKAKNKGKAKVSWTIAKGISGYEIVYGTNKKLKKNVKTIIVKSPKKKAATIKKLKAGKKYFFKICPYTNVKDLNEKTVKVYGKWSKVVKIKAKK